VASLQPVRGTHDLLPEDMRRHRAVVERLRHISALYGFEEMATPIFEFTDVFSRTLGETSDVVTKEMYTFERSGDQITLRPEGTAGICRAFISNGLAQSLPIKAFYHGPMFRYERPQKGRQRQFHQVGIELLGVEGPQADLDVLAMAAQFLDSLGLQGRVNLEINTLGDSESRTLYRDALVAYLTPFRAELSSDSQTRLEKNPLRILDSKDPGDRKIIADAPVFSDSLNDASKTFFATVLVGLDRMGIAYTVNPRLVRGLDYYCHTAFEFTTDALGAQGTVLAGGRYDSLIQTMGGPATPGIGWAAGVERLAMLVEDVPAKARPIALIPLGEAAEALSIELANSLRRAGVPVDVAYGGNMKKRMKRANTVNASHAVILGDDELARQEAAVRNLDSGEQQAVSLDGLLSVLSAAL
jgi:histidyl-tRNA synthetase